MNSTLKRLLLNSGPMIFVSGVALVVTLQNYLAGINYFWGGEYTFYNNYLIFKNSFFHLLENKNLYILHLTEYADLFKYSPAFALFMGLFAYAHDLIGLLCWNLLNCLVFYYGVRSLRALPSKNAYFILGFCSLELVLTTQASQSNALIAGLLMLAFSDLESGNPGRAAFFIAAGVFIKLFALAALLLFIFHKNKIRGLLFLLLWLFLFAIVPLVAVSPDELASQYLNWWQMLEKDHSSSEGRSIFAVVSDFTGHVNQPVVLGLGSLLLLLPLIRHHHFGNSLFRLSYFSAILIWIVIFNHKAESPTYIIVMSGCAIWATMHLQNVRIKIMLVLTWLLSSLIKTDLVPESVRAAVDLNFVNAFMPTVIFLVIVVLLTSPKQSYSTIPR